MLVQEVHNCSFDSWYPDFTKVTFKSRILPIPDDVLEYLLSDEGVVLPIQCDDDVEHGTRDDDADDGWSADDEEEGRPSFPEFCALVREAMNDLGGAVMPKLNWSSPRDAVWMGLGHSLKCSTLSEIFLLLKSSDFVVHDLTRPFEGCEEPLDPRAPKYVLVLRKWCVSLNPGNEFRCFVKDRRLIGITQRDPTHFYVHVGEESDSIQRDIKSFFAEQIQPKFQSKNYVFDVFRVKKDRVKLVDFNRFSPVTDPHLFEWSELTGSAEEVDFRFVEDDAGIQPNGLSQFSLPRDFVDLASGTDPNKLVDFLKLQGTIQEKDDS